MGSLTECVYSPLMEEEDNTAGWSKETIDYISKHKTKVQKSIRGIAKGLNKLLQTADVEDIYADVIMYMYNCDDYDISKAINRSSSGTMVSLEGYVHSCVKYCVMRYVTNTSKKEHEIVRDTIQDSEGKELSIFDTITDDKTSKSYDGLIYDIGAILRAVESYRYYYGPDLYMIWYIRLLTYNSENKDAYKEILEILDIDKKELSDIERKSKSDDLMTNIAKAITKCNVDEALEELEKYVYSHEKIKRVAANY